MALVKIVDTPPPPFHCETHGPQDVAFTVMLEGDKNRFCPRCFIELLDQSGVKRLTVPAAAQEG